MSSNAKSRALALIGQEDQFTEISMMDVIKANKEVHINLQAAAPFVEAVEVALGVSSISMDGTEEVDLDLRKKIGPLASMARGSGFRVVVRGTLPTNILSLPTTKLFR